MARPERRAAAAVAAILLLSAGCDAPRPEAVEAAAVPEAAEVRREPGLDVLLITVDTLRADALGAYGRSDAGTPWMDRLADEGVRFVDAHAHNVVTLPAHASLLSGLYPQEHGVRDNSGFRFPREVATLATVLADHGYRTGAFVSAFPLDSRFGLDVGFEVYDDSFVGTTRRPVFFEQERSGVETVELARRWLESDSDKPTFCWVHLYEPHFPYSPPGPLASRYRDNPYQGDVAAADAALGPLVEPLLRAGDDGSTLVVLTSDHGESLGEHGEATHGIFAYQGALRVPLILYQPRLFEPRVVDGLARHIDVMPTVLDALDLPLPEGIRGRSLLPAAAGQPIDDQTSSYFEALSSQLSRGWAPLYGIRQGRSKYIELPIPELYDLALDPDETRNLAGERAAEVASLRQLLLPLRELDDGAAPDEESEEVRRRLESLGYLSGDAEPRSSYGEADDPKRLIALDEEMRRVTTLYLSGDLDGALRAARELVRRRPGMKMALFDLAHLERESGNLDAAVTALEKALALHPEDFATLALLATYLTQAGRADEAAAVTQPHAALERPDLDVLQVRALALARLGRFEEAYAMLDRARQVDPAQATVPIHRGTVLLIEGRREEARAEYQAALKISDEVVTAHTSLGMMALEEGDLTEAVDRWRRAVELDAELYERLAQLGVGLWRGGRPAQARPLLELFVESAPEETYGREIAGVRAMLAGSD